MSTNYFNPISYVNRPRVAAPVQMPTATSGVAPANPAWSSVTGWSPTGQVAAPNQGQIQGLVAGLYGTGRPGEAGYVPGLNERAGAQFGRARNDLRDNLRGFGGFSFRNDDPATTNVDESLMVDYQPDQLGSRERQAVLAARAQANARGMMSSGFGDQMIGAALQRVGEEARQIVNQYSQQINQIATQYFDPLTGQAATTLGQIASLYGADMQWQATQEGLRPPPPAPPPPPPAPEPPPAPGPNPGTVQSPSEQMVWRGAARPNLRTLESRFPNMNFRVVFVNPTGAGSDAAHYRVFATPK